MTTPTELDGKVSIGHSCIRIRRLADVAVHAVADAVRAVEFGIGEFCGACRRDVTWRWSWARPWPPIAPS